MVEKQFHVIVLVAADLLIVVFELVHIFGKVFLLLCAQLKPLVFLKRAEQDQKEDKIRGGKREDEHAVEQQDFRRIAAQAPEQDIGNKNAGTDRDIRKQKLLDLFRDNAAVGKEAAAAQPSAEKKGGQGAQNTMEAGKEDVHCRRRLHGRK